MASGGFSITIDPKCFLSINYILGLLNSKLFFWRLYNISNKFRGGWITCTKQYVSTLPIKKIDFSNKTEKSLHDKMVEMVTHMLELQKKFHTAKLEIEKEIFKKQIDILDYKINKLVYELYELTPDEINIIEKD